jgi:glycogen debranching enzyme
MAFLTLLSNFLALIFSLGFVPLSQTHAADCPYRCEVLRDIARQGLDQNTVEHDGKRYITAGAYQYRSIWTRDFSYSVPGFLADQRRDEVRHQLELILSFAKPDGLLPKGIDTMNLESRIIRFTFRKIFHIPKHSLPFKKTGKMVATYTDSLGSQASDSALLIILAVIQYDKQAAAGLDPAPSLLATHQTQLLQLFHYAKRMIKVEDGLLHQKAFSDWQDSVKREGASFLNNLLYLEVLKTMQGHEAFAIENKEIVTFQDQLERHFWDQTGGVFRSMQHGPHVSLEGNLFAIDWGLVTGEKAKELYANLKKHYLWVGKTGYPGFPTYPKYPRQDKGIHVKLVHLEGYHEDIYWSWLMAMSAKIAYKMGDWEEGERISAKIQELAIRDQTINEVYRHDDQFRPFKTWAFEGEGPFTWGCSKILEMLEERARAAKAMTPELLILRP